MQCDDERMIGSSKDFLLGESALDFVSLYHLAFAEHLHSVQATRLLLPNQVDLAHIALAEQFELVETPWPDLYGATSDGIAGICTSKALLEMILHGLCTAVSRRSEEGCRGCT